MIEVGKNTPATARQNVARENSDPTSRVAKTSSRLALPVTLLFIGFVIPFIIIVGPLRLSVYRLVLLAFFFPVLVSWLRKDAGPIRPTDLALLFFCFWNTLSYAVIHDPVMALERGGIMVVETMGAYLFGRCYIQNAGDFHRMVRLLFWIIAALLPFAMFEALTGKNVLLDFFRSIYSTYWDVHKDPRWGMRRVQGPFEHPILFGVFCGSVTGLAYLVLGYQKPLAKRLTLSAIVPATAFFSLSSGPLIAVTFQVFLLLWNGVLNSFKNRWYVLLGLFMVFWGIVQVASNRSMPQILISILAFNTSSAWNRLRIWEYGSASVLNHPVFGIGLNDWVRAPWMVSSVDMFWLVPAMRHGIPSGVALHLAVFFAFFGVLFKKGLSERQAMYRMGFLISIGGFYVSGWTVHYWNATYVLFMFLLGSGMWLMDAVPEKEGSDNEPAQPHVTRAYSRFPVKPSRSVDQPNANAALEPSPAGDGDTSHDPP